MREMSERYNKVPFEAGRIDRLGIPGIRFTDGPRGVALGSSTAFPVAIARAASWDPDLERAVADVIGAEARAQGANLWAGICINLAYAPGWGRAQESYGEDPLLLGAMGAASVEGVNPWVMSCVKHFALNSMEEARFRVDVRVAEDVLREVYLPHFRTVVDAGVDCVMSAYNSVNGSWAGAEPASAHRHPARRLGLHRVRADRLHLGITRPGGLGGRRSGSGDAVPPTARRHIAGGPGGRQPEASRRRTCCGPSTQCPDPARDARSPDAARRCGGLPTITADWRVRWHAAARCCCATMLPVEHRRCRWQPRRCRGWHYSDGLPTGPTRAISARRW